MSAPASASARQCARPCPRAAPVTSATCPVRSGRALGRPGTPTSETVSNRPEPPVAAAVRPVVPRSSCRSTPADRDRRIVVEWIRVDRGCGIVVAEGWMTVSEAAHALGMSRTTLLAAEEAGLLTPLRTPGGHRRYSAAELSRYLRRSGCGPLAPATPDPDPAPQAATPSLVAALRTALRAVARAVDADSAGVYLRDATGAL